MKPYLSKWPAGKVNHEPVQGGLAKHTWEVVTFCNNQLFLDKGVDRDVLIFSALYHDIGKIREYNSDLTWAPEGRLVPHVAIAVELITQALLRGVDDTAVPKKVMMQIMHCIMAHHGKGNGAVNPATREAVILHYADATLGLLGHFEEAIRRGNVGEDGWGAYSQWLETAPYVAQLDDRDL
jgi:3'-5' exoribonuclease